MSKASDRLEALARLLEYNMASSEINEDDPCLLRAAAELVRAAIEYAQKTGHSEDCNKIYEQAGGPSSDDPEYKCTCGYDALMAALPEGSDNP